MAAGLVAAAWLFYRPSIGQYFFLDDFVFLERSALNSPADVFAAFSVESNQRGLFDKDHSYRPISTNLYFGLTQLAFGLDARAFHVINLLTLSANALLLWLLLLRMDISPAVGLSMALVYALSAINFESQLWISVFQELSVTFFGLAAVLAYSGSKPLRGVGRLWAVVLYTLALLCKETAISVPALLLLWDLVEHRRVRDAMRATAPYWAVSVVYIAIRSVFFVVPREGPYAVRLGSFVLTHLVTYGRWSAEALIPTAHWPVLLFVAALAAGALWVAPRSANRSVVLGLFWFLLALGPVIFMPNHIFEYYLTLPMIGLIIAAATLLDTLISSISRAELRYGILLVLCFAFALSSHSRFELRAAARERDTRSFLSIISEVHAHYPELPNGTMLFFDFPRGFPIEAFLKDSGAVFRVVYRNPTLRAAPLMPDVLESISRGDASGKLAFRVDSDGTIQEYRSQRPVLPSGS